MKEDDIMKDDITRNLLQDTENLYAGIDLHKKYYTGTIMDENGKIVLRDNFPPTMAGTETFFCGVPTSTKIANGSMRSMERCLEVVHLFVNISSSTKWCLGIQHRR